MALRAFVKVSGVNNLSDARYCAGMGVDLLGFVMDEDHPDFLPPEKFKEICEWLSGVDYVGEFHASSLDYVIKTVSENNLGIVQVNNLDFLNTLTTSNLTVILKWPLEDLNDLPYNLEVDFLMIHADHMPSTDELELIKSRTGRTKVILDTSISESNVDELLRQTGAYGIGLTAGHEIRPGYKDYDELADILELLEIED